MDIEETTKPITAEVFFDEGRFLIQSKSTGTIVALDAEKAYEYMAERFRQENEAARTTRTGSYQDGIEVMQKYAFPIVEKDPQ